MEEGKKRASSRYTPGPWGITVDGLMKETFVGPMVKRAGRAPEVGTVVATIEDGDRHNARIVAAAPEMYEGYRIIAHELARDAPDLASVRALIRRILAIAEAR